MEVNMITEKQYKAMAKIIKEASWLIDRGSHTAKNVGINPYDLVYNLGYYFQEDNPNFDCEKWLNACTPEQEEV